MATNFDLSSLRAHIRVLEREPKFPLFGDLLDEVKLQILRHRVPTGVRVSPRSNEIMFGPRYLNIAMVSKEMHELAADTYYRENKFLIVRSRTHNSGPWRSTSRSNSSYLELSATSGVLLGSLTSTTLYLHWSKCSRTSGWGWTAITIRKRNWSVQLLVLVRPRRAEYKRFFELSNGHDVTSHWRNTCQ
jgi:hypothetical protein